MMVLTEKVMQRDERKVFIMLLTLIGLSPILFTGWVVGKTVSITKDFISYDIKLADAKRNNPEKYRMMKEKEAEIISYGSSSGLLLAHTRRHSDQRKRK